MNKKGFLLGEETLKIVLSVIGILLLLGLLALIYFSFLSDGEEKQAKSLVERISNVFLEMNEGDESRVNSLTPAGWFLQSFVGLDEKPPQCFEKNCICLCDEKGLEKCAEKGFCSVLEKLVGFETIEIKNFDEGYTNILLKKVGGDLIVERVL